VGERRGGLRGTLVVIPPKLSAIPETKNQTWARNPVDRFILNRIEREGLSMNHQTRRRALVDSVNAINQMRSLPQC
jgi:hypothetical protein